MREWNDLPNGTKTLESKCLNPSFSAKRNAGIPKSFPQQFYPGSKRLLCKGSEADTNVNNPRSRVLLLRRFPWSLRTVTSLYLGLSSRGLSFIHSPPAKEPWVSPVWRRSHIAYEGISGMLMACLSGGLQSSQCRAEDCFLAICWGPGSFIATASQEWDFFFF